MSIPENELRINNWYYLDNPLAGQKGPEQFTVWAEAVDFEAYGSPIPLSPAWLERAHFQCEPVGHNDFGLKATWAKGSLILNEYGAGDFGYSWGEEGDVLDVLYVHQLQNLYFSLTNKELPLNP